MKEDLFIVDHNKTLTNEEEYFTMVGLENFVDNNNYAKRTVKDDKTFAQKITRDDGSIKYSIRVDTDGKLYNPINMYDKQVNRNFLDKVCRSSKFRNVNYKIFDFYINFLNSKNLAWLNNAEREAT
jgi:hypothetical protein